MIYMLFLWIVCPLVLVSVSFGYGFYVSLALKRRTNFALLLAIGFSIVIILGTVFSKIGVVAPYSAYIISGIGLVGAISCGLFFRNYFNFDRVAAAAGIISYSIYSLPVALSGRPGWTGWIKLDDTATWFAVTDRLVTLGQSIPDSINSTYDRVLQLYVGNGIFGASGSDYPLGAYVPYGVMSKFMKTDVAWLFQPYMSLVAGLSAMLIVLIARKHISRDLLVIALSVTSICASTLYSYVMWGGVKEIVLVYPLTLLAFSLFQRKSGQLNAESITYASLSALALFFVGGKSSIGFILPMIGILILLRCYRRNRKLFRVLAWVGGILSASLILLLVSGNDLVGRLLVPPNGGDPGNLARPLKILQVMGIWPAADFRLDPQLPWLTYSVIIVAVIFAIFGIIFSIRRSLWTLLALVAASTMVTIYSSFYGGIWFTAKAISVASPFFVLLSCVGVYHSWNWLLVRSRNDKALNAKLVGVMAGGVAIVLGVGVSDALTFANVSASPYSQLNELKSIGEKYAGQGPALMTEYSVFGARYFLRGATAESASELRVHLIPLKDGSQLQKGWAGDIGLFANETIDYFNLLVLRKSPVSSRPQQNYSLDWSGEHFEVWRRNTLPIKVISTLGLGSTYSPGEIPSCSAVSKFLATKSPGDRVFAVERAPVFRISFADAQLPEKWVPADVGFGSIDRSGPGSFSKSFDVPTSGFYNAALAGSFPGKIKVLFDGNEIYSGGSNLEANPTLTQQIANVFLNSGQHLLSVEYSQPIFQPGSQIPTWLGPLFLSQQNAGDANVEEVAEEDYGRLCRRNLDWIAIGG